MSAFVLSKSTIIEADENCHPIRNAVDMLRQDIAQILTAEGKENVIRVVMDASLPEEHYIVNVAHDVITLYCADALGAVYALLCISERFLGVKPFGWWNNQQYAPVSSIEIPSQEYCSPKHVVRFRGWFINDESLLDGWKDTDADKYGVWRRCFETILRCGGNMVIAGTDRAYDGEMLNRIALDMGLWLTQHHTELLGARMFGRVYPQLFPSYTLFPDKFEQLWEEAIDRYSRERVIWAVGFRGQGDKAFWDDDHSMNTDAARGAFISKVIRRQIELVCQKAPDAHFCTNLYGEMMNLYRQGYLDIPDGVIKVWGDNGYGRMVSRRQHNDNPRTDAMPDEDEGGENGIYYHVGFYDLQAANHTTMLQSAPRMVARELRCALERHADVYWIINAGSIKPHVFMLDLVRQMWTAGQCDTDAFAEQYAACYYGTNAVAPLLTGYADSAIQYGPNEDERAGDQFYHFPLRTLAWTLLRGKTEAVSSLCWVAGDISLTDQARRLCELVEPGLTRWKQYVFHCEQTLQLLTDNAAQLLKDSMMLQGTLHLTGCEGLYSFCQACGWMLQGNELQAYLWTHQALEAEKRGLAAMRQAEHGRFTHFYRNDCFTNVALSVRTLESVRGYLRVRGDGEMQYDWEKRFLAMPSECRVVLQTHRSNQLDDATLAKSLMEIVGLKECFIG